MDPAGVFLNNKIIYQIML